MSYLVDNPQNSFIPVYKKPLDEKNVNVTINVLKKAYNIQKNENNYNTESARRTVREITDYFESISKSNSNSDFKACGENIPKTKLSNTPCKSNPIFSVIKPNFANSPFIFTRKSNSVQCDINLSLMWRHAMFQSKHLYKKSNLVQSKKSPRSPFSVRESLRASFMAGILMLQYVI